MEALPTRSQDSEVVARPAIIADSFIVTLLRRCTTFPGLP